VPVGPTLIVCPLQIHGDGIVASGSDWEQFSFANPRASVAEFLRSHGQNL
jgi:hypothetical protein